MTSRIIWGCHNHNLMNAWLSVEQANMVNLYRIFSDKRQSCYPSQTILTRMVVQWQIVETVFAFVTYRHVKNWFINLLDRIKVTSYWDSKSFFNIYEPKISIYDIYTSQWPFYCPTFKCDLDLQLIRTNVSNEYLCQIILKSMHKCRSYGPDKLNLWPFYH